MFHIVAEVLANIQKSVLDLKLMYKETEKNRYTAQLHTDLEEAIKKSVKIHKLAEEIVLERDGDITDKQRAYAIATAPNFIIFFNDFNEMSTWYTRFKKPEPKAKTTKVEE